MLELTLCQIGFTTTEAHVYMTLLRLGPQAGSVVARRVGVNRSSIYAVLKGLQQKGVVSSFRQNHVQYFAACDPNMLVGFLDRKCRTFDHYRRQLLESVQRFRNLQNSAATKKPMVSYFEGIEGVKQIFHEVLTTRQELCMYLAIESWVDAGLEPFLLEFKDIRIITQKLPLRIITPDTTRVRAFFDRYPKGTHMTHVLFGNDKELRALCRQDMVIYDDKVAIVQVGGGLECGIVLQHPCISAMQRSLFDIAWETCCGEIVSI